MTLPAQFPITFQDVELLSAPDVEDFLTCWLQPLLRTAVERGTDDVLPFCVVQRITGVNDDNTGTDDSVVQLDVFGSTTAAAKLASRDVEHRMALMARHLPVVTMSDGSRAAADFVENTISMFRDPYMDDQIVRYVARYRVGLSYAAV